MEGMETEFRESAEMNLEVAFECGVMMLI